jgi:hypothetical protein
MITPIILSKWTPTCYKNKILHYVNFQLNPHSRVLLEKLVVAQLLHKFPNFMELEGSLQSSQNPATGPYPDGKESSPFHPSPHPVTFRLILI